MEYDGTEYITGNDNTGIAATTWTITHTGGTGDTIWVQPSYNTIIVPELGNLWGHKTLKKRNSDWDEVDEMFKEKL